jgi:uncharacterized protein (DUF58 family)
MYPTRRMIFVALAGVPLALLAAMVEPSLWLAGPAWTLFSVGLFLLDAVVSAAPTGLRFSLQLPEALSVAQAEDATLALSFGQHAPSRVELAIDVSNRLRVVPDRQICAMEDGGARIPISLVPLRRGEGLIDALWTRWQGPLGLCWKQRKDELDRKIAIIPNIVAVKDEAVRLFQREAGGLGLRMQLRAAEGTEFNALKEFQPGQDRRSIDWKQSAKHGKLLAREYQAEENLHIIFALDTGRLMCEPLAGLPRIDRAIQALLLISYVALRLGDRVGLFAFNERPILNSGTVAGPNSFQALQRLAARIDYSIAETNFTLGLTQLSSELEHRSIVIVFTDFSDTTSAELMIDNLQRLLVRHRVLFVAFRDEELEDMARAEPREPADVSRAVLADAMLRDREAVTARLRRMGASVVDVPVDQVGMRLLETYLTVKQGRS